MLVPLAFLLGAFLGWKRATRRGGDRKDQLQYAAAHAIALSLVAVFLSILITRMGWI